MAPPGPSAVSNKLYRPLAAAASQQREVCQPQYHCRSSEDGITNGGAPSYCLLKCDDGRKRRKRCDSSSVSNPLNFTDAIKRHDILLKIIAATVLVCLVAFAATQHVRITKLEARIEWIEQRYAIMPLVTPTNDHNSKVSCANFQV
ncbi:unnamed protein product [Toxocara canis]|uniref:Uncharacterized protein n=1 Tax=Toxocara canis TaxID=6265 RepID=A0A183UDA6_TOXCA|nr:unnamed protein product [Toxocara canis]